ncbi:MAG: hypothetical protein SPD54_09545 [Parabacteroides sp.]|nr:hypothetical protein [Parabacteroides sp.]
MSRFQRGGREPALEQERSKWEERDRPQRMGVKRSEAEGGTEMDAV